MREEPRLMKIEFNDKMIDATFHQLKPSQSIIFISYLGKLIGGSAGKIIASMEGKKLTEVIDNSEFNPDKLGDAVTMFFEKMGDEETIKKLNILLSSVHIAGEMAYLDHPAFEGNLPQLFKVLKLALEVNYGVFFNASSGLLKKVQGKMALTKSTNA